MMFMVLMAVILLLVLESCSSPLKHRPDFFKAVLLPFCGLVIILALLEIGLAFIPALLGAISILVVLLDNTTTRNSPFASVWEHFSQQYQGQTQQQQQHKQWQSGQRHSFSLQMDKEEACAILGVSKNATKQEIKRAYHAMIAKNHPDHGGSVYLATKINQARDVLYSS